MRSRYALLVTQRSLPISRSSRTCRHILQICKTFEFAAMLSNPFR